MFFYYNRLPTPPDFPDEMPEPFRAMLSRHSKRYQKRIALAVWLLSTTGYSVQIEVQKCLAELLGLNDPESGSIKRLIKETLDHEHGLLIRSDPIHLVYDEKGILVRLSEKGEQLARALGYEPVKSEWGRFQEEHEHGNSDQQQHTLACLKFAYTFRMWGYPVQLLPKVGGRLRPDLMVLDGKEPCYLEVETKPHSDPEKWRAIQEKFGQIYVGLLTERAATEMGKKLSAIEPRVRWTTILLSDLSENNYGDTYYGQLWGHDTGGWLKQG